MVPRDTLVAILDLARWAPSGDNTQPWRFEVRADGTIAIHGFDTRDHVIYDLTAMPATSRMARCWKPCALRRAALAAPSSGNCARSRPMARRYTTFA